MKDATAFDVEGLVKGYLRGTAWHCTFYTPAGRQRRKLGSKNKGQVERRAREIAEFIQREDWEALVQARREAQTARGDVQHLRARRVPAEILHLERAHPAGRGRSPQDPV